MSISGNANGTFTTATAPTTVATNYSVASRWGI